MYPTIVTVEYWDEGEHCLKTEGVLIYAGSFAGAAEQVEGYYGHSVESMRIQMYEEGLFRIDTQHVKMIEEKL